jgi:hypothetical protein
MTSAASWSSSWLTRSARSCVAEDVEEPGEVDLVEVDQELLRVLVQEERGEAAGERLIARQDREAKLGEHVRLLPDHRPGGAIGHARCRGGRGLRCREVRLAGSRPHDPADGPALGGHRARRHRRGRLLRRTRGDHGEGARRHGDRPHDGPILVLRDVEANRGLHPSPPFRIF